jgi:hypothetical protein
VCGERAARSMHAENPLTKERERVCSVSGSA